MKKSGKALTLFLSVLALAALLGAFSLSRHNADPNKPRLILYCAANMQPQMNAIIPAYEKEFGVTVQAQYGGSGQLLSNLEVSRRGDLFLAADTSYITLARQKNLIAEVFPLARMRPVILVPKGNPKKLQSVDDLLKEDVRVALANPDQAAIGQTIRRLLSKSGQWDALAKHAAVLKPTVNDLANDVKLGSADAAIVWDTTARQYPDLDAVPSPVFDQAVQDVTLAVLCSSEQPSAAIRFARYVNSPEHGQQTFKKDGYELIEGDTWAPQPEIVFYSGAVNRTAIDHTIAQFEQREGCRVNRIYNGCGILVSQMKTQQKPDAYLACDISYVPPVADLFLEPKMISETAIIIAVPKGNPKGVQGLNDLIKEGVRVGLANPPQSTLGALTKTMLEEAGLYEKLLNNVRTQTPTADVLVNQAVLGTLDAVIVYEANVSQVRDKLDIIRIPSRKAVQPFAIGKQSSHKRLVERLRNAICSDVSRKHYESLGFQWRAEGAGK
ncbi:MAG TPA: molybdate ABC transporter substrate-binding protein [Planctomycetota bacterium]|jgi:molybdenum ABC transporter molybdate-binding protein